jgi:leucyl-tRNA synthetase
MSAYDFTAIEKKWQQYWHENQTFVQPNPGDKDFVDRPKMYVLDMFPYPSGAGLHVGHPEGYTATDIVARFARMSGYNVLHPMGYDSFGLPAQQYAVEHGIHPKITTQRNIDNIERQIKMFGFSYDWSRRVATTDPQYYRWTQWIFLKLFNSWYDPQANAARPIAELEDKLLREELAVDVNGNLAPVLSFDKNPLANLSMVDEGQIRFSEMDNAQRRRLIDEYRLAYMAQVPVNWCPMLGTVLANEEVTNEGTSDRGNFPVYRRALTQWMLRITAYAQRLEDDLALVDWPESIKIMQRNWIGKSSGAEIDFPLENIANDEWFAQRADASFPAEPEDGAVRVYTTRPDTLFGATYMVLAPEHPLVKEIATAAQTQAVEQYVAQAIRKSELERMQETKEKTGVFTGAYAINPINRQRVPIWVADYVLMGYGTGAIMAVPAHDTRDYEFATRFDLPVIKVVEPPAGADWRGFVGDGTAVNSGPYSGLPTADFKKVIAEDLAKAGVGKAATNFKLRDWIFSRQWYWGEPFPIIHCEKCGTVALPEEQLPLVLPEIDDFNPVASSDPDALPQPPLGRVTDWVNTTCPRCGGRAKRETNAMPQWAGSCWYYLRYLDPKNDKAFCDPKIEQYWMHPTPGGKPLLGEDAETRRRGDAEKQQKAPIEGVDLYVGGAEHAVLHLLYARFWHKVLMDLGYVSTPEPFGKLFNQGMIRSFAYRDSRGICVGYDKVDTSGDDGKPRHKDTGEELVETVEKMSKSLKNVVNPDDVIGQYGADTFRLYEMFMGPLEASKPWNTRDVPGVHRFLNRVWSLAHPGSGGRGIGRSPHIIGDERLGDLTYLERALNKLIKKVSDDIRTMKFNTAIAAMMGFINLVYKQSCTTPDEIVQAVLTRSQYERFVLVLAPFAPHIAEELWQELGHDKSLAREPWPVYDESLIAEDTVELPVQVNGKMRGKVNVPANADDQTVLAAAMAEPRVAAALQGKTIVKQFVVKGRLVNLVVK